MDDPKEGYLLIGTAMLIMTVFLVALFLLMIIYRRRKLEHVREMETIKEKYQKEMLETQLEIQKNTMQEIGREIHDSVGQKLTLASLYTAHLELVSNHSNSEKIRSIIELIDESLNDLRELSQSLTQQGMMESNIDNLLQKEVTKLNEAKVCSVHFATTGRPEALSLKVNTMILRIVQEFFHNSIRHSGCKNIYVEILYEVKGFKVELKDDGKGFVISDDDSYSGIGLNNMKKRAGLINAELTLKSYLGEGATLTLFIPSEHFISNG